MAGRQYSPALDAFIKVARARDWTSAPDKLRRASTPSANIGKVRKADAQGAGASIKITATVLFEWQDEEAKANHGARRL